MRDLLISVSTANRLLRTTLLLMAIGVNLARLDDAAHPWAVIVAMVVMAAATTADWLVWRDKPTRETWLLVADVVITAALVLSSRWALGPEVLRETYLGLTVYWMVSTPITVAINRGTLPGLAVGAVIGAMQFAQAPQFHARNVLDFICMLLAPVFAGVIAAELHDLMHDRDRNYASAAALSERERLNRIVHDGVLQVLALVEREGRDLGPRGRVLAKEARKQEDKLRLLLQDRVVGDADPTHLNLTNMLEAHQSERVTVSTMASDMQLDAERAREIDAAVSEVLLNVEKHAGPDAKAWVLLETDDEDEIVIWVRDNGVGLTQQTLSAATAKGHAGVAKSIVGRVEALGGHAEWTSKPGRGVEWQFTIPKVGDS